MTASWTREGESYRQAGSIVDARLPIPLYYARSQEAEGKNVNKARATSLSDQILNLFETNKSEIDRRLSRWISDLSDAKRAIEDRAAFKQWRPLRVYISISGLRKASFSLRFLGQEVGVITVEHESAVLRIGKRQYENNNKWFAVHDHAPKEFGLLPGAYPWQGPEARKFRGDFQRVSTCVDIRPGIPEHLLESKYIKEMEPSRRSLFVPQVYQIRPVKIANCPLQLPLPLSASKGYPEFRTGHVDILARRGHGRAVRLSVWELKKPRALSHAAEQAYIYALTLRHVLRSGHGPAWYHLCGFRNRIPAKLTVEAVVAISQDRESKFRAQFADMAKVNKFNFGKDRINFFLALYDESTYKMISFDQLR
jgi:hypothetical protein